MSGLARRPDPAVFDLVAAERDAALLAALVRECQMADIPRTACLIRISLLPLDWLKPYHLRMVRVALEPLLAINRTTLYTLPNRDIVVVWRGDAGKALGNSREEVKLLFSEIDLGGDGDVMIWEDLTLPKNAERLLALAETPSPEALVAAKIAAVEVEARASLRPMNSADLVKLEGNLAQADVSRFVRRRQMCKRLSDGRFQLYWERRHLEINEIGDALAPGFALQGDPWLFRRLTRTLDRRMLSLLSASGELINAGPFSIHINVASILGPEFLRFDEVLPIALRGRVVLELQPADVMSDLPSFIFACDFARERGYRLLLHGTNVEQISMLPLRTMKLDWLDLVWSDTFLTEGLEMVDLHADRLILSHVDTPAAVAWSVSRGISLFQGRMAQDLSRGG